MSSGFGTKKGFLERLQAQKEANKSKAEHEAQFAEEVFKSITERLKSISDDLKTLGDASISINGKRIAQAQNGDYVLRTVFNRGNVRSTVMITLNQTPESRKKFTISGLSDDAKAAISNVRTVEGVGDITADTNQGAEIAQAIEDFAVKFFAATA